MSGSDPISFYMLAKGTCNISSKQASTSLIITIIIPPGGTYFRPSLNTLRHSYRAEPHPRRPMLHGAQTTALFNVGDAFTAHLLLRTPP